MSPRTRFDQLREAAPAVLPSLLLCDFGNLKCEIDKLEAAGVRALHLDVMDGNFVDNLTYGMPIVEATRRLTDLPLDVHLMIREPERYVERFFDAGADAITIHIEATQAPRAALEKIRSLGAAAGVAFNPSTPLERVLDLLDLCDLALVMSVEAGFGGQSFQPVALERLAALRERAPDLLLEVDGGIKVSNIADCADSGAHLFVVGSAIFRSDDYRAAIEELTRRASSV